MPAESRPGPGLAVPFLLAAGVAGLCAASEGAPGKGISEALAQERAGALADVRYDLHLTIPERRADAVLGRETVHFTLHAAHRVVLDFEQPREKLLRVKSAGRAVPLWSSCQ